MIEKQQGRNRRIMILIGALAIAWPWDPAVAAALPANETFVLQRVPIPGTKRELGMGVVIFPPNSSKPHQKAKGPETCFVVEGDVTVRIDGRAPTTYRAGQSFALPANVPHRTTAGPSGARLVATWVHQPGTSFNVLIGD